MRTNKKKKKKRKKGNDKQFHLIIYQLHSTNKGLDPRSNLKHLIRNVAAGKRVLLHGFSSAV